jgi:hypothetical protein
VISEPEAMMSKFTIVPLKLPSSAYVAALAAGANDTSAGLAITTVANATPDINLLIYPWLPFFLVLEFEGTSI